MCGSALKQDEETLSSCATLPHIFVPAEVYNKMNDCPPRIFQVSCYSSPKSPQNSYTLRHFMSINQSLKSNFFNVARITGVVTKSTEA